MGEIKDFLYIIITIGSIVVAIVGLYWRMRFQYEKVERQFCEQDERLQRIEKQTNRMQRAIERKINVIEKNIVRLLEKQGIEPAQTLFEDDEV